MKDKDIKPKRRRFGRLTIIGSAPSKSGRRYWRCRCICGNEKDVAQSNLHQGTKSCGCLRLERVRQVKTTHGKAYSPEYAVWVHLRQRCRNPNNRAYSRYGGRGITVDPRWDSFAVFFADMGPRPSPQHTIDRIRNNEGYGPENCRWATRDRQGNNKRNCHYLTHKNRTQTLAEWAKELGVPYTRLHNRFVAGWAVDELLTNTAWQRRTPQIADHSSSRMRTRSPTATS